ncbi:MAG TPA: DNA ligase D [Alphaproteobacteria bacterium]|jgi:bifunctional non-homologous end joining protein LigD
MALRTYRKKRDFTKTQEPSGGPRAAKDKDAHFVVHKHDASHLHFDLRLEMNGVLKSWAVPKGPSLDPADKRLAVEVEDHPLEYGGFEGSIPKGQYGGGTVQLWDRGPLHYEGDVAPSTALKKGDLKFTVDGEHMRGSWALVRMVRRNEKRNNWLLIKHKDAYAKTGKAADIASIDESVKSGRSMAEIAGDKPAKKSAKAKKAAPKKQAVKKAAAKKLPRKAAFIKPQLATLAEHPPGTGDWIHEVKFDGYRVQCQVRDGEAVCYSRKGLDWTHRFSEIAEDCSGLGDCILDGEVVALNARGETDFSALQAALSEEKTDKLVYYVFDLLAEGGGDLRELPLSERKARLEALLDGAPNRIRYVSHFDEAGEAVLKSACRMAFEGVVSKRAEASYQSGRNASWLKTKCRGREEFVVGGYWPGSSGKGIGALLVGLPQGKSFAYKGRVGTGYNQAVVSKLLPQLRKLKVKASPFEGTQPASLKGLIWVKPQLVAEVEYAGWTADGILRQAAFKGLRDDKSAAEVGQDRARKVVASGKAGAVVLTNPDKKLWPDDGVTKADLAAYFRAVGPALLRFIQGRPISILRIPDGIGAQQIFQRHRMGGMSALIEDVKLSKERQPYLMVNRVEGLEALAQLGTAELHAWGATADDIERPDQFTIDLDPDPAVSFADLKKATLEVRDHLESLGFAAYLKLTGGKGLHVVTPLEPAADWERTKTFAHQFVSTIAEADPKRFVTVATKARRKGKIFLDYLRNGRGATAIVPWSPRARPGAPISLPVPWSLLEKARTMPVFTIKTLKAAEKASDPWRNFDKDRKPLKFK